MNLFTPAEVTAAYASAGAAKTRMGAGRLLLLAVLAGFLIAMGGAVASSASHGVADPGLARVVSGVFFPFALASVILTGAELFTGNTLIVISVLDGRATVGGMLRNWLLVYLGNGAGAMLVAAGCFFSGQMSLNGGALAASLVRTAAAKCALPFGSALILGIFCNALVTLAVLLSLSAKDVPGRILGAFLPVSFFVICGFEHSIANFFYIPAGLLAYPSSSMVCEGLSWGGFLWNNLLPVTLGNIVGGVGVGALFWFCHLRGAERKVAA